MKLQGHSKRIQIPGTHFDMVVLAPPRTSGSIVVLVLLRFTPIKQSEDGATDVDGRELLIRNLFFDLLSELSRIDSINDPIAGVLAVTLFHVREDVANQIVIRTFLSPNKIEVTKQGDRNLMNF